MQAQHVQAQQLMQAQQIANIIYGSQQHIPGQHNRNPMSSHSSYGSSPHLSQSQQQQLHYNHIQRPMNREPIQCVNEQGQYMSPNVGRESSPFMGQENGQYVSNAYNHSPQQMQQSNQYSTYQSPAHTNYQTRVVDMAAQQQSNSSPSTQFYLHENTPPQVPARRTWAQSATNVNVQQTHHQVTAAPSNQQQILPLDINAWSQNSPKVDTHTWRATNLMNSNVNSSGFMLHQQNNGINSTNDYANQSQLKQSESPQHGRMHRQIHTIMGNNGTTNGPHDYVSNATPGTVNPMSHHNDYRDNRLPVSPSIDDMAPQSISFIGDEDSVDLITEHPAPHHPKRNTVTAQHQQQQQLHRPNINQHEQDLDLAKLNITSGKLTYRIPSPTRPSLNMNSFQVSVAKADAHKRSVIFDLDLIVRFSLICRSQTTTSTTNKKVSTFHSITRNRSDRNRHCAPNDRRRRSVAQMKPISRNKSINWNVN